MKDIEFIHINNYPYDFEWLTEYRSLGDHELAFTYMTLMNFGML